MYSDPRIIDRQLKWTALSQTCKACSLVHVCGGGYFPHRYSNLNGFQNPSIYCADLMKLIRTIHARVASDLDRVRKAKCTTEISFKE